jgi:hypothetical protein
LDEKRDQAELLAADGWFTESFDTSDLKQYSTSWRDDRGPAAALSPIMKLASSSVSARRSTHMPVRGETIF